MNMCLASAADALVPRMARSYTDEQVVESIVDTELAESLPADRVAAAKAHATNLVARGTQLDVAIKAAIRAERNRALLRDTMIASAEAVVGKRLVSP